MLAMIITGVALLFVLIGVIASVSKSVTDSPATPVTANAVLVMDIGEQLHEQGMYNSLSAVMGGDNYTPGLFDILRAIKHAGTDNNIRGMLLRINPTSNGWATLAQVRMALEDFKATGKFIYAYGETIRQKPYYLAGVADSVYLNPVGYMEMKGFSTSINFYKKTLEKLEVEPQIFYAGEFKSASEPFREDKMSEPNRLQLGRIQQSIWDDYVTAVADHTGATTEAIHQWTTVRPGYAPAEALNHQLVDGILYWDEVEGRMAVKTDKKPDQRINYIRMNEYAGRVTTRKSSNDNKIAVLLAEGDIVDGEPSAAYEIGSAEIIRHIRRLKQQEQIKAVVLRINSRGGSAMASEVILRELRLLQEKKPLIISMGDIAASGGYYMAAYADSIFAMPNTITGSIGVFTMFFHAGQLMSNKLGITTDQVKNAPFADFPSYSRPMNKQEKDIVQSYIDSLYLTFKSRVAEGRNMNMEQVETIARGRVWTGNDALSLGLVDGLGSLDRAIQSAAWKAGLSSWQVVSYPEPVDQIALLLRQMKSSGLSGSEALLALTREPSGSIRELLRQLQSLADINGKAMMVMPFQLDIR